MLLCYFLPFFAVVFVGAQEVFGEGEGKNQIGMDMYTFCQALGPKEVRGGMHQGCVRHASGTHEACM